MNIKMKPILFIPVVILILLVLYSEIVFLLIPLLFLKITTGDDYSRSWMVRWAENLLIKFGHIQNKK